MVGCVIPTNDIINKTNAIHSADNQWTGRDIALDIEINLNNRPYNNDHLTYVDSDIELPILAPNSLIYSDSIRVPENEFDDDDTNLLKHQRYIKQCKQAAWNHWKNDYLRALHGRHDMKHKPSKKELKKGDIVIINLMKRIEDSGKLEMFISCSKVKMVLFEEFAFVQERVT